MTQSAFRSVQARKWLPDWLQPTATKIARRDNHVGDYLLPMLLAIVLLVLTRFEKCGLHESNKQTL